MHVQNIEIDGRLVSINLRVVYVVANGKHACHHRINCKCNFCPLFRVSFVWDNFIFEWHAYLNVARCSCISSLKRSVRSLLGNQYQYFLCWAAVFTIWIFVPAAALSCIIPRIQRRRIQMVFVRRCRLRHRCHTLYVWGVCVCMCSTSRIRCSRGGRDRRRKP